MRYGHRPMACGLLDCTDTAPILDIAGKDLLTRFDCIENDDPILPLVQEYENLCPCPDLQCIRKQLSLGELLTDQLLELETSVIRDLSFRGRITAEFGLSVANELFYFGRPLFQLLHPLGLQAINSPAGIRLVNTQP